LLSWLRKALDELAAFVVNGVPGTLVALLQFAIAIVLIPIVLVLMFIEWLVKVIHQRDLYPERIDRPCPPLPESLTRRPDPCIYSQSVLHSQGLPFTYDNPDIWITDPATGAVVTDLKPNTQYVVNVRVHNASIDPAIGVRVALGFLGHPGADPIPVEQSPLGGERYQFVDVGGLSSTATQFNWRSPRVSVHPPLEKDVVIYGLQVRLSHPADANPSNNVGQEHVTVMLDNSARLLPGDTFDFSIPFTNPLRHSTRFSFDPDIYSIDFEQKVTLHVRFARGRARWSLAKRLYNIRPTLSSRTPIRFDRSRREVPSGRFRLHRRSSLQVIKARYDGFDVAREALLNRDWSLPPGVEAGPVDAEDDLEFAAAEERRIRFRVSLPGDAKPGSRMTVNFVGRSAAGDLLGGFSLPLRIGGEVE
jgi:hypothetical protein